MKTGAWAIRTALRAKINEDAGRDEAMSEIAEEIRELEQRITAALDQIGQGLEGLDKATTPDTGEIDGLRGELEDERTANAQLEERLRAVNSKNDKKLEALEKSGRETRDAMDKLDGELGRLRAANAQLRENNQALREANEANEAGVGEAHLINKAMLAELEALRATRAADIAESGAIMAALAPLLSAVGRSENSGENSGENIGENA
jgi:chromosome segregation ATPase